MVSIRRAIPDDAATLTRLARQAKASWGYPSELLSLWESELLVTRQFIAENAVFNAVSDEAILGFCALCRCDEGLELEHMWVRTDRLGEGIGRALWAHVATYLEDVGADSLRIVSDPNAEGFYLKMGAVRVGEVGSAPTGRRIPLLMYRPSKQR